MRVVLANRTNDRASATMLRLSVRPPVCLSFVDDVYIVAKRGVLLENLSEEANRK